jgi:hypothetical protein
MSESLLVRLRERFSARAFIGIALIGLLTSFTVPRAVYAGTPTKKVCHTVTKKVHGKKTKVKVCKNVPKPTATVKPSATATPAATPTATAPPFNAQIFQLPVADYPTGSTSLLSDVESNAEASANSGLLHFGPLTWDQEGRITGYFQGLHVPFADSSGVLHTVLLVDSASVFASHDQAVAAWTQERATWLTAPPLADVCNNTTVTTAPTWGESSYGCVDVVATTEGVLEELSFVRGRFYIQVDLGFALQDFNIYKENVVLPAANLGDQLALQLDAIAKNA